MQEEVGMTTRRNTLTEKPINPQYMDEAGRLLTEDESKRLQAEGIRTIRLVPDDEMEERIKLCMSMIERESRRYSNPKISFEEMKANAIYALWRAALTDKWMPTITMEGFSRRWVRQICQRAKYHRSLMRVPLKKRWFCTNPNCENHNVGMAAIPNADGTVKCPSCDYNLKHKLPPMMVQIDPLDKDKDDQYKLDLVDKGMPEELKAMTKRLFEAMHESAKSPDQKEIVNDLLTGLQPVDIARNRKVSRQMIHMTIDKLKGRAITIILEEYPREDVDRVLGRDVVDKILDTTQKVSEHKRQRIERKKKNKKDMMNEARIMAGEQSDELSKEQAEANDRRLRLKNELRGTIMARVTAELERRSDANV
jgi:hypothetical protein